MDEKLKYIKPFINNSAEPETHLFGGHLIAKSEDKWIACVALGNWNNEDHERICVSKQECKLITEHLASCWNSYSKNCANPIECAEWDLLGEALEAVKSARDYLVTRGVSDHGTVGRTTVLPLLDAVLEKAKGGA